MLRNGCWKSQKSSSVWVGLTRELCLGTLRPLGHPDSVYPFELLAQELTLPAPWGAGQDAGGTGKSLGLALTLSSRSTSREPSRSKRNRRQERQGTFGLRVGRVELQTLQFTSGIRKAP